MMFRVLETQAFDGINWRPVFGRSGACLVDPREESDQPLLLLFRTSRFGYRWHISPGARFSDDGYGGRMWAWSTWSARQRSARRLLAYLTTLIRP